MKNIGVSINEAIDWTQDHLGTTRPLAERTLFSMLHAEAVTETENGFILLEDEQETDEHFRKTKNQHNKNRLRYRSRRGKQLNRLRRMDNSDAAEDMMVADESSKDNAIF